MNKELLISEDIDDLLRQVLEKDITVADAKTVLLRLISDLLKKRDEEWRELIPILKKQGAWEKVNEQIIESLSKIGEKDWSVKRGNIV
jgi:hypothetical protein